MKSEFEHELVIQGYYFEKTSAGYYSVRPKNHVARPIRVELIVSRPVNQIIHGSQNGNELDGIGYFLFRFISEHTPDYFTFAFKDLRNDTAQYMIIPTEELRKRLKKNIIRYRSGENLELRLWLIGDYLYETTNLGLEGEYYYLSEGRGGRLIDETIWNYSRFLNNWVLGSWE
jgi:hypothetical protein